MFAASGFALAALQTNTVSAVRYESGTGTLRTYVAEKLSVEFPAEASIGKVEPIGGEKVFTASQSIKVMANTASPNIVVRVTPQTLRTPFNSAVPMKVLSTWGSYGSLAYGTYTPPSNTWASSNWTFKSDALDYTQTNNELAIAGEYVATVDYFVESK